MTDNGGNRSDVDRRESRYTAYIPERRSGRDQRKGFDRRSPIARRKGCGRRVLDPRRGFDRRSPIARRKGYERRVPVNSSINNLRIDAKFL